MIIFAKICISIRYKDFITQNVQPAGFVVNKLYGNVFQMGKVSRGMTDFKKLIYFTEEEAYLAAKMIEGIDNNHVLKRDLQRKLASVYDSTSIANYIGNTVSAEIVEALASVCSTHLLGVSTKLFNPASR